MAMQDYVLQSQYDKEIGDYDNVRTVTERMNDIEQDLDPNSPGSLADQVRQHQSNIGELYDFITYLVGSIQEYNGDEIVGCYLKVASVGTNPNGLTFVKLEPVKPTEKPEYKLPYTATELTAKLEKL